MALRRDLGWAGNLLQQLFIGARSTEEARRVRGSASSRVERTTRSWSSMRTPFRNYSRE